MQIDNRVPEVRAAYRKWQQAQKTYARAVNKAMDKVLKRLPKAKRQRKFTVRESYGVGASPGHISRGRLKIYKVWEVVGTRPRQIYNTKAAAEAVASTHREK